MRKLTLAALAGTAAAVFATTACMSVPAPASDNTPPMLKWHVENRTANTAQDITGSGSVTGAPGDDFRVTLTASDPEGIHQIDLGGGFTEVCQGGGLGQNTTGDFAGQSQTLQPDAQNKVLTSIFLIANANHETACNSGFDWKGTTIEFTGDGVNYFNGKTNGTLSISESP
jgi:hypothetical protein